MEHQLAVLPHRVTFFARIRSRLAQGFLAAPQPCVMRPLRLLVVLVSRCLCEGPGQAATTGCLWLFVLGREGRGVNAGQFRGKVRVLFEEPV